MHTTSLRKVGGSVMLAVPPVLLELLRLNPGARVGLSVDNGRLVIEPRPQPRYTLAELLAECEASAEPPAPDQDQNQNQDQDQDRDREWLEAGPVGRELL